MGRRLAAATLSVVFMVAAAVTAAKSSDYPSRTVTMIVPFGAGTGADAVARIVAKRLRDMLNTRVIIDNKAGANGALGATAAARAAPDGYTLLLTSNTTHSANPSLLRSISYDPVADFAPIARVGNFVYFLATSPATPGRTVADLVAHARANPDALAYAYSNGTGVVAAESFKRAMGIEVLKVPYKSTPPALTDMMAGRIAMMFVDAPSSTSLIQAGSLRALAVSTQKRSAIAPDIPSLNEVGVPDVDITAWAAVFAPAGTPPEIVDRLNGLIREIVAEEDVRTKLAAIGFDAFSSTPDELRAFVASELTKWTSLVKAAGIEPE